MRRRNAVFLLIATAVVGTTAWLLLRPSPEDLMAEFVAELRARGEPVTIADMEPPLPPDDDNGADDLALAFRWLEARLAEEDRELELSDGAHRWESQYAGPWDPDIEDPWYEHVTPEQVDELREFLDTMGPLFDGVAVATSKREIAWPMPVDSHDLSLCGPAGLDSFETWYDARRLIAARAVVAAAPSDRLDAAVWLLALVRRTRLRTEMDHRFAATYRRLGCVSMRDGIEDGRLDALELRRRVDGLLCGGSVSTMPRVLRAQRTTYVDCFPLLCDGSLQVQWRESLRVIDRAFNKREPPSPRERVGDAVDDALEGVRFDWPAHLMLLRQFDALIPDDGTWTSAHEVALAAFEDHATRELPGSLAVLSMLRGADAADALARVALAACEHRSSHGDWPQTCAELSPLFPDGVPVDPYTDAPFVMTRDGATLVLRASRPGDAAAATDEELRDAGLVWRLPPW